MATHVVIDGSNIATEGRSAPSLRQLKEAMGALRDEHPTWDQIVVADATFGHRIDAGEVGEFDKMVEGGQIVTPPAGAIGRGDAFVLTIADKAGAVVLSNDSFQEFHGRYAWLFEEGRLIGGKPVPHVGWVFVLRSPVRGPLSRRSVRDAKTPRKAAPASKSASEPMPTPKVAPPTKKAAKAAAVKAAPAKAPRPKVEEAKPKHASLNDLLPFLEFVGNNPVGSTIEAEVSTFSSHGAYVTFDGIRAYAPLRHLGEPAPRSAREVLSLGERRPFVVVSFSPERRGIDVALPGFVPAGIAVLPEGRRGRGKGAKPAVAAKSGAKGAPKAAAKKIAPKAQPPRAQQQKSPPKAQPRKAQPSKAQPKKAQAKKAQAQKVQPQSARTAKSAPRANSPKKAAVTKATPTKPKASVAKPGRKAPFSPRRGGRASG
jgi:hypothetical protein